MIRDEETRAAGPVAALPQQSSDVTVDIGVAVRHAEVGSTPGLADAVELAAIVVKSRERVPEGVRDLQPNHPQRHGEDYGEQVTQAVEVEDLRFACALGFESDYGPHLVDGQDVRWRSGRRRGCFGRRRRFQVTMMITMMVMMGKDLEIVMMRRVRIDFYIDRSGGGWRGFQFR